MDKYDQLEIICAYKIIFLIIHLFYIPKKYFVFYWHAYIMISYWLYQWKVFCVDCEIYKTINGKRRVTHGIVIREFSSTSQLMSEKNPDSSEKSTLAALPLILSSSRYVPNDRVALILSIAVSSESTFHFIWPMNPSRIIRNIILFRQCQGARAATVLLLHGSTILIMTKKIYHKSLSFQ